MKIRWKRTRTLAIVATLLFLSPNIAPAQNDNQTQQQAEAQGLSPGERLQWWRDARFGMFVHWGPVSLQGTEIGWSRGAQVPTAEYDQLYRRFNPEKFDASEWVAIAKAAGMRYLVFTSKHHDGFCMWDSRYTDYDIMATPFARDVLKELAEACRQQEIRFCTYHSVCDWRHPDYPLGSPGGRVKKSDANMPRYEKYLRNQTREIVETYGPLGIMWFDGEWESPWTRERGNALYRMLLEQQPSLIINNRVSKGRRGMAGTTDQSEFNQGDYDTPEQRIGEFNRNRPWETCMTLCRQWSWKPEDEMKSRQECLQTLIRTVGGDGNLLLNVGPMPDGRIEPRQVRRLHEIGAWLDQNGTSVYGTRGGPFLPDEWGVSTCRGNKIFLFVMRWPDEGPLRLPAIPHRVTASRTLAGERVVVRQMSPGMEIDCAESARGDVATVIELTIDGVATELPQIK